MPSAELYEQASKIGIWHLSFIVAAYAAIAFLSIKKSYKHAPLLISIACILIGSIVGPNILALLKISDPLKILDKLMLAGILGLTVDIWMHHAAIKAIKSAIENAATTAAQNVQDKATNLENSAHQKIVDAHINPIAQRAILAIEANRHLQFECAVDIWTTTKNRVFVKDSGSNRPLSA